MPYSDDSIPLLDEVAERPEERKKSGKRRLSDEDIRKILESDNNIEDNQEPSVSAKKARIEKDVVSKVKHNEKSSPKEDTKKSLSTAEISKMVNEDTPVKKAKLIEPLPQPSRHAKRRGISESTVKDILSKDTQSPSCSKWLNSNKKSKNPSEFKDMIKTLRKEKLKNLASSSKAPQKDDEDFKTPPTPVAKQKTNVKRSEPKIFNFLQQGMDCKPKQKQPSKKIRSKPEKTAPEAQATTEPMVVVGPDDQQALPKAKQSKKSIRWVDQHNGSPLEQIKFIPNENMGKKVAMAGRELRIQDGQFNQNSLPVRMDTPPNLLAQKIAPVYTMNDIFQRILNWSPQWLGKFNAFTVFENSDKILTFVVTSRRYF